MPRLFTALHRYHGSTGPHIRTFLLRSAFALVTLKCFRSRFLICAAR